MTAIPVVASEKGEEGNLLLDVPLELVAIPTWLASESQALGFKQKDEYHVTVIGVGLSERIRDLGKTEAVAELIGTYVWSVEISNQYIELAKDDDDDIHRQSIICMVEVPQLAAFYEELSNHTNTTLSAPPAHITLYTKNYDRGIGVYNQDDLMRLKVRDLNV